MSTEGMNPDIQAIESLFTPGVQPQENLPEIGSYGDAEILEEPEHKHGVFVQRNQNIAPYFKEYCTEKRRVLSNVNQ
jgi:hypothetical protein